MKWTTTISILVDDPRVWNLLKIVILSHNLYVCYFFIYSYYIIQKAIGQISTPQSGTKM